MRTSTSFIILLALLASIQTNRGTLQFHLQPSNITGGNGNIPGGFMPIVNNYQWAAFYQNTTSSNT